MSDDLTHTHHMICSLAPQTTMLQQVLQRAVSPIDDGVVRVEVEVEDESSPSSTAAGKADEVRGGEKAKAGITQAAAALLEATARREAALFDTAHGAQHRIIAIGSPRSPRFAVNTARVVKPSSGAPFHQSDSDAGRYSTRYGEMTAEASGAFDKQRGAATARFERRLTGTMEGFNAFIPRV